MTDFLIDMEWHRCPDGYRLERSPVRATSGRAARDLIVPNSDKLDFYRPFAQYDVLYSAFAKIRTSDELIHFIDRFGPLDLEVDGKSDVQRNLKYARYFRDLLHAKRQGPKKVASVFTSQIGTEFLAKFGQLFRDNGVDVTLDDFRALYPPMADGFGNLALQADADVGIRIKIQPNALVDGLWIQLSRKLAGNTAMRTCRQCNSLFEVGPGTSKRADATFCCSEHSVLFHSLKRSRRK